MEQPDKPSESTYKRLYAVAQRIPFGKVATYGQLAALTGRCTARMAGYAMAALPSWSGVPWHRVINSQGMISVRTNDEGHLLQRALLESEGIHFDGRSRIDLIEYGWQPDDFE